MRGAAPGGPRGTEVPRGDLLRLPLVGRFLRWRRARLAVQLCMGALAVVLVVHGLFGPTLAPKNLATLLVWVHWRGALVAALLLLGNVFCFGCPLLLPRELARRVTRPVRRLPRALRTKYVGLALFVLVLFLYEWLDLWASPAGTAWLILGYAGLALVVDASFSGAPFCKWVCPIGQFNFLASTLSPHEVRVRAPEVCDACATKDCIRGRRVPAPAPAAPARVVQRGCELDLFLPRKVGNLDCTFCLDCVHACPSDNVAIARRVPAEELLGDETRSGLGRLGRRRDLALFVVVFTFGALLNAFGMVSPVYAFQSWLADVLGTRSEGVVLLVLFALCLVVLPLVTLGPAALLARGRARVGLGEHVTRFVWSLAPLGFGVWLAHYSFHFLTGLWTFVPVAQHALAQAGVELLGKPRWGLGGLTEAQVWPLELGFLALGTLGSLSLTWRLAKRDFPRRVAAAFTPWAAVHLGLAASALWLLAQPMEMRGTYL
ncbi:MAG: FesM [Planctomycetes bacterium]|nr:FesM [Planctomycetota bacterium]